MQICGGPFFILRADASFASAFLFLLCADAVWTVASAPLAVTCPFFTLHADASFASGFRFLLCADAVWTVASAPVEDRYFLQTRLSTPKLGG